MTLYIDSTKWRYEPVIKVELLAPTVTVHCGTEVDLLPRLAAVENATFIARCENGRLVVGQTAGINPRILMRSIAVSGAPSALILIQGVEDKHVRATLTSKLHQHLAAAGADVVGEPAAGGAVSIHQYNAAVAAAGALLVQLQYSRVLPDNINTAALLAGPKPDAIPQDIYDAIDNAPSCYRLEGFNARAVAYQDRYIVLPSSQLLIFGSMRNSRADTIMPMLHDGRIAHGSGMVHTLAAPIICDSLEDATTLITGSPDRTKVWKLGLYCVLDRLDATLGRDEA